MPAQSLERPGPISTTGTITYPFATPHLHPSRVIVLSGTHRIVGRPVAGRGAVASAWLFKVGEGYELETNPLDLPARGCCKHAPCRPAGQSNQAASLGYAWHRAVVADGDQLPGRLRGW